VSEDPQVGGPFDPGRHVPQGGFDLSQILRMLQSEGPVNWEVAEQVASWTSGIDPDSGEPSEDPDPDPDSAARLHDLVRAARTHTAAATGLTEVLALPVTAVNRRDWATTAIEGLHTAIEVLAGALGGSDQSVPDSEAEPGRDADPLAGLMQTVGPVVIGVQAGTMIGFLAQSSLALYDLPLPLSREPRLTFVLSNIDAFAEAWSLPPDDLRFVLALRETVHAAQRSVPWVRERLLHLSCEYVSAYRFDPGALEAQLASVDLSDPESWGSTAEVALDPAALLDAMRTPEQEPILRDLQRFAAVLEGYADVITHQVGSDLVAALSSIDEALRRHRVERGRAEVFVDRLLGLEVGRDHYERGINFCRGVVERAGTEGLNRLWADETMVPTSAEVDAPGLWLARIDLAP